jgi:hypothetical protein
MSIDCRECELAEIFRAAACGDAEDASDGTYVCTCGPLPDCTHGRETLLVECDLHYLDSLRDAAQSVVDGWDTDEDVNPGLERLRVLLDCDALGVPRREDHSSGLSEVQTGTEPTTIVGDERKESADKDGSTVPIRKDSTDSPVHPDTIAKLRRIAYETGVGWLLWLSDELKTAVRRSEAAMPSGALDAIGILTRDRDEWKRRALAKETPASLDSGAGKERSPYDPVARRAAAEELERKMGLAEVTPERLARIREHAESIIDNLGLEAVPRRERDRNDDHDARRAAGPDARREALPADGRADGAVASDSGSVAQEPASDPRRAGAASGKDDLVRVVRGWCHDWALSDDGPQFDDLIVRLRAKAPEADNAGPAFEDRHRGCSLGWRDGKPWIVRAHARSCPHQDEQYAPAAADRPSEACGHDGCLLPRGHSGQQCDRTAHSSCDTRLRAAAKRIHELYVQGRGDTSIAFEDAMRELESALFTRPAGGSDGK